MSPNPRIQSDKVTFDEEEAWAAERELEELYKMRGEEHGGCVSSCRRLLCCGIVATIVVIGVVAGVLVMYTGGNPAEFFVREDPPGYSEAVRWDNRGQNGLTLNLVNSLEDRYTLIFNEYVTAWDEEGTPDVLTLTTQRAFHDPDCSPIAGQMNVCNGNYGDNGWRGVNVIFLLGDYVEHSVAKLNDFYLDKESDIQKQYTMCHELGHGFGLPHTDENYFNRDRGDCMDYTSRPHNNLRPGHFNFDVLNRLYGVQNDTSVADSSSAMSPISGGTPSSPPNYDPNKWKSKEDKEKEKEEEEDRRRNLKDVPAEVMDRYFDAMAELDGGLHRRSLSSRILHTNEHSEHSEVDLGQGYRIHVSKFLVQPSLF